MFEALRHHQQASGAQLNEQTLPLTFGNDAEAFAAASTGTVLVDRSHWGLIEVAEADRLRFLHNQTTNTFQQRQPGESCETVFITSTGRTIDLVTAYIDTEAVRLLTSPGLDERLMEWMDRYIFFADKVKLTPLTGTTAIFSIIGPDSHSLLKKLGVDPVPPFESPHHAAVEIDGLPVHLSMGSGLALPGYTLFVAAAQAADLWQRLVAAGALPAGEQVWQQLRIQQGRPMPGAELTEDYNPLEAGLWHTITFEKGCYIGQETIARLHTYKGVKQQLWGLQLSAAADPGTPLTLAGEKVGVLTSLAETPGGWLGLGYIRTKAGGANLRITAGDAQATTVDVPYLSRGYLAEMAS